MALLVQAPQEGINTALPDTLISPREAGRRSQNVIYENGYLTTPNGFAAIDITTGLDKEHGGLSSNSSVLNIFPFSELDDYEHLIAVTKPKIYEHDRVNNDWNDRTQSGLTMISAFPNPVSFVAVPNNYGSTDSNRIHFDDDTGRAQAFFHILVSNGGLNDVQRWAGRFETDFADLLMTAGDYGGTTQTTHRCWQVASFRSRTLLISPRTFDTSTNLWTENNQDIRWNVINKPQTWVGTGSGSVTLLETGGRNVWSAPLNRTYIIYQTQGIWDLNYVGGFTVFDPRPMIPDLGLLAPHLLAVKNNVHYFVGTDFNVYAYFGGSVKQRLGDKIHPELQDQLSAEFASRSWMAFGPNNKRVWIFIVPDGEQYATKAYGLDIRTGAWQVKDFKDLYTTTTGITSVDLIGSQSFVTGDSYNEALNTLSQYDSDVSQQTSGDTTIRYGDVLRGDTTNNAIDWTQIDATLDFTDIEFSEGGLFFCFSASADPTILLTDPTTNRPDWSTTSDLIMRIDEGSDSGNMPYGSHYYSLTDISSVDAGGGDYTVKVNLAPRDTTGNAAADSSGNVPSINSVSTDTTATLFDPSGDTYRQSIAETLQPARLMIGDSSGFVYEFDSTYTQYAGNNITSRHFTHVEDFEQPDKFKRWSWISVTARENPDIGSNGGVKIRHRIKNFDTSDTAWRGDFTVDLSSSWKEYKLFNNITSKLIQYEFDSASGSNYQISEYKIGPPQIQDDR
jgi:hypothetical protein